MRILALDLGEARVGCAMGDTDVRMAGPCGVLAAHPYEKLRDALQELVQKEGIEQLVIGLPEPKQATQERSAQAKRILEVGEQLGHDLGLPVTFENESFTSKEAHHYEAQIGSGKRDDVAAAILLQSYLDRHS